jgi:hypothetical protein
MRGVCVRFRGPAPDNSIAMGRRENVIGGAAVLMAGALAKRARGGKTSARQDPYAWRVVTVLAEPDEIAPAGQWPQPLSALGDAVEIATQPAPGGRGTELKARLRDGAKLPKGVAGGDGDPRQAIRSALRQAKQLVETGEILQADEPGTTRKTTLNAPLREAISVSGGEGRL